MKSSIKLKLFIGFLIILFSIFLYFFFKSYEYTKKYKVNKVDIIEKYHNNEYLFELKYKKIKFNYKFNNKYTRKRELIDSIKIKKKKDEICIIPISKYIEFYPLCSNKEQIYSSIIANNKNLIKLKKYNKIKKKYKDITINYLNNKSYLLFNYKGFYYISNDKSKNIKLFNNDVYRLDKIINVNNYLIIPDYNQNYYFNKIFIIDFNNGNKKEITLENEISFDFIYLGNIKNDIYLFDKKEEKEYKINIKRNIVEEIDYGIIDENKFVSKNLKEIKHYKVKNNDVRYKIIDNYLYEVINKNNIKLSNLKIDNIISNEYDTVYYIVNNKLYMFNHYYGEILLLSNNEWSFNNINMIFISE